jgi:hypothetical protein
MVSFFWLGFSSDSFAPAVYLNLLCSGIFLALKRLGSDHKVGPRSVFKPNACDFCLTGKNPLCLLCLPFSDKCGRLVRLHDREMFGLEMDSVTEEPDIYFWALSAPPTNAENRVTVEQHSVCVHTQLRSFSCHVTQRALFQRNFTAPVIGNIQKNSRYMGILVQISVLIYVGNYSCTYLAPKMTCI